MLLKRRRRGPEGNVSGEVLYLGDKNAVRQCGIRLCQGFYRVVV